MGRTAPELVYADDLTLMAEKVELSVKIVKWKVVTEVKGLKMKTVRFII